MVKLFYMSLICMLVLMISEGFIPHFSFYLFQLNLILRYMKLIIKRGKEVIATGSINYQDLKAAQKAAKAVITQPKYKGCYVQIDKQV